jgi:predicted Zn-dependent protease
MRKLIIAIACCIVLLLLGYAGHRGYQVWKQNHLMQMAKAFAAKPDINNELLCLQQVLRANPRNLEACRMMAALTEAARSPGALIWRQRVVELSPQSVEDRLALARAAMIFKDYTIATNTLNGLPESAKNTADYHNLAGVIAVSLGQTDDAAKHFSEAARLEPGNPVPQVNLAVVRLHGSNSLDMAEARIDLRRISQSATNASLRAQATRELVVDALRFKDNANALALSQELTQPTNTLFSDKLLRLDVLKETKNAGLNAATTQCQHEAAANSAKLSEMTTWLMLRSSPAAALTWLHSLPNATQTNQPAALLIGQCQILTHDWNGLQASLAKQNWSELEFVRHAFMARALREQKLDAASTAEWELALKYASNQKSTLISLFKLAAQWNWVNEAEEILWTVVNRYPEEPWAAQALQKALIVGGRTRPLMQLFSIELKRSPADLELKNNLAMVAMLLDAQELNPYALASEVYAKAPQNPSYVSTYAFSLYLQKKYADALKVMQKLSPQALNDPGIAGYYGLILKATGDNAKAQSYLNWTTKAQLLPEERKLFEQAQNR